MPRNNRNNRNGSSSGGGAYITPRALRRHQQGSHYRVNRNQGGHNVVRIVVDRSDRAGYDGVGVPWDNARTVGYAGQVTVPNQPFLARCRMAKRLKDFGFTEHPVDHWLATLSLRNLGAGDLEFILKDSTWTFLIACWVRYNRGFRFTADSAASIHENLKKQMVRKQYQAYFGSEASR